MIEPYISLKGKAGEAIDFYEKVFNASGKKVMHYKDAPPNPNFQIPEPMKELVLYSDLEIAGTKVHISDTQSDAVSGNMISLSIMFPTAGEVEAAFSKLKEGGEVLMELGPQFFSPMYGWVKDRYGVSWQLVHSK